MPSTLGERVLARARADLKAGVREVPDGSNQSPRIREMQRHTWLPPGSWPWCVAAVQAWYAEAGHPLPYRTAGAYDLGNWARKVGWNTRLPKPGDIVIFRVGSGHAAILERADAHRVWTVDGNAGNRVSPNARDRSLVRDFIHVPSKPKPVPTPKKPRYEVVTSAGGHSQIVFTGTRLQAAKRVADKLPYWLAKGKRVVIRRKRS